MLQTKPDYMLVERGRYHHQRKVPLDLQPAIGVKTWRAPFAKFKKLYAKLPDDFRTYIRFVDRLPDPMDDDEGFGCLSGAFKSHFGLTAAPPSELDERDEFDFAKMALKRKIARVTRPPDTLRKVADRFHAFANSGKRLGTSTDGP